MTRHGTCAALSLDQHAVMDMITDIAFNACPRPQPEFWARDDTHFTGGGLHGADAQLVWPVLMERAAVPARTSSVVLDIVQNGVDAHAYFVGFEPDEEVSCPGRIRGVVAESLPASEASGAPPRVYLPERDDAVDDSPFGSKRAFKHQAVMDLVASNAVMEVDVMPHCVMQLLVVVGSKKLRLALDCDAVNRYSDKGTVVYPTLNEFARGIEPDDEMVASDCMNGYHTVALQEASWKYFGFEHRGRWYVFKVLPFGWRSACVIYQTIADAFAASLRSLGIHCVGYLDDAAARRLLAIRLSLAQLAQLRALGKHPLSIDDFDGDEAAWARERGCATAWILAALLALTGFTLSRGKSQLVPTRQLTFLGLIVDSHRMAFNIPEVKHARAVADVAALRDAAWVSVHTLQVFAGRMMALAPAAPAVHIFLQPLWRLVGSSSGASNGAHRSAGYGILSLLDHPEVGQAIASFGALRTWELSHSWGRQKHTPMVVYTDACLRGMGGVIVAEGDRRAIEWRSAVPPCYADCAIHVLEALAVLHMLREHAAVLRGRHVDLFTDNEAVRWAILNFGVANTELNDLVREIYEVQLAYQLTLHVHRVATEDNVIADTLSRTVTEQYVERSDHMLTDAYFAHVCEFLRWNAGDEAVFTIDICANQHNRRVHRFYALQFSAADGFEGVNALCQELAVDKAGNDEVVYCNPPWCLIGPLFTHARECRARGVLVFPVIPTCPWYGEVISRSAAIKLLECEGVSGVFAQPSRGYRTSVGPLPWPVALAYFDFSTAGTGHAGRTLARSTGRW